MSRTTVYPAKLAYRGVLIERPCVHCDTTDLHFDGKCSTSSSGPCTVCGLSYRRGGWPTHPVDVYGDYLSDLPMHDFTPGTYAPADFERDVPVAFDAIISLVLQIGMPEHFTSDLFRDYQLLSRQGLYTAEPPKRFIFAVRSTGTDIILPHAGMLTEPRLRSNERFFAWDQTYLPGLGLNETSEADAKDLLYAWHAAELHAAQNETCTAQYCPRQGQYYDQHGLNMLLIPGYHGMDRRTTAPRCHGDSWHDGTCTHIQARA